jgi:hypothetical protein
LQSVLSTNDALDLRLMTRANRVVVFDIHLIESFDLNNARAAK